jgi:hypothetical protein
MAAQRKELNEVFQEICMYASTKNTNGLMSSKDIGNLLLKHNYPYSVGMLKQLRQYCIDNNRWFERAIGDDQMVYYYIGTYDWDKRIHSPTILNALELAYTGKTLKVFANDDLSRAQLKSSDAFSKEIWVTITKFWQPNDVTIVNAYAWNDEIDEIIVHF